MSAGCIIMERMKELSKFLILEQILSSERISTSIQIINCHLNIQLHQLIKKFIQDTDKTKVQQLVFLVITINITLFWAQFCLQKPIGVILNTIEPSDYHVVFYFFWVL